jgi:hypothetical protein
MAAWPSGKAEDCKSFIPSSNLGAALKEKKSKNEEEPLSIRYFISLL